MAVQNLLFFFSSSSFFSPIVLLTDGFLGQVFAQ